MNIQEVIKGYTVEKYGYGKYASGRLETLSARLDSKIDFGVDDLIDFLMFSLIKGYRQYA